MKISFVITGWARKPGGGNRVIYTYASALAERGHDVVVTHAVFMLPRMYRERLYPRREARTLARGVVDRVGRGGPPSWFTLHPSVEMRYVTTLAERSLPHADATVATAWRTAEPVAWAPDSVVGARFYFVQHHEVWDAPPARVDRTWRLPLRKIVIAKWLEEVAVSLGTDAGAVRRIPNAIDLERFRVAVPVEGRPMRVAMLWSAAPVKGGDVGLRALAAARSSVPDLSAVLFGVGPPPASLPPWAEYRRNPPQEELVGDVYNGSAVYLCPSWSEGWHLPPAEAMACGCAVVSTAIDGVADYAVDGETALLAPAGDADGLARRLVSLFEDEEGRVALARRGHEAISRFDWKSSTDAFEQALVDGVEGRWLP